MITTEGKNQIKRYLAGYESAIARSMAVGVGARAESLTDAALHLETTRMPVSLNFYDFINEDLVFKATVPADYEGQIYEIGLYSLLDAPSSAEYASRTITTFDSATEQWVSPSDQTIATFGTTSTRVGADSLLFTPAASTTTAYALQNIYFDLSGYSSSDSFTFAFNVGNANTSDIVIRFMTDTSNYYSFSLGAQTAGYKITEVTKGAAVATGTPSWQNISQVQVLVTSAIDGASSVELDAIRVEDKDSVSLDYVLVARKVLAVPETKEAGVPHDIEFRLDVSVS